MFIFIVLNTNTPYLNNSAVYEVFPLPSALVLMGVFEGGLTLSLLGQGLLTLAGPSAWSAFSPFLCLHHSTPLSSYLVSLL